MEQKQTNVYDESVLQNTEKTWWGCEIIGSNPKIIEFLRFCRPQSFDDFEIGTDNFAAPPGYFSVLQHTFIIYISLLLFQ